MELAHQVAALHEQPVLLPRELTKLTTEEIKNTSLKEASLEAPTYTKFESVKSEQAVQTQPLTQIEIEKEVPSKTTQPMTSTKEGFVTINLPGAYGGTGSNSQPNTSTISEDDKRKRVIIGGTIILALLVIVIVFATKKK